MGEPVRLVCPAMDCGVSENGDVWLWFAEDGVGEFKVILNGDDLPARGRPVQGRRGVQADAAGVGADGR